MSDKILKHDAFEFPNGGMILSTVYGDPKAVSEYTKAQNMMLAHGQSEAMKALQAQCDELCARNSEDGKLSKADTDKLASLTVQLNGGGSGCF